ncbi:MAG: hypothetical protein ACOC0N_02495 [Chroococcales cyanobacterium]
MFTLSWQAKTSTLMAALMVAVTAAPLVTSLPAEAQLFPSQPRPTQPIYREYIIPSRTTIPVKYDEAEKILVSPDETVPITLEVAANIRNRQRQLLIPYNSEIVGKIEPASNGTRFVAETLIIGNQEYDLNAVSDIITERETIDKGTDTRAILKGAAIGAAAAAAIGLITGDVEIARVLGGAGLGALGGWLTGGRREVEVISIDPNDLDITLNSSLALSPYR